MYVFQRVIFGDKFFFDMVSFVMLKIVDDNVEDNLNVVKIFRKDRYMDDFIYFCLMLGKVIKSINELDRVFVIGSFQIKEWLFFFNVV